MSRRQKPARIHADYGLAEKESAADLNERFYSAAPHEYFARRLRLLMLEADPSVDLGQFGQNGLTFGGLTLGGQGAPDGAGQDEENESRQQTNFLITEAAGLLHHVGETLLRLYLAHERRPPCPWLSLVRQRDPGGFKRVVRKRFVDSSTEDLDLLSQAALAFFGTDDPKHFNPEPRAEQFRARVRDLEGWLRYFANVFLDDAPLYNSIKHGLAVQAGEHSFRFSDLISGGGPGVLFLEQRKEQNRLKWAQSIRWLQLDQLLAAVSIGTLIMQQLWEVGRVVYVTRDPNGITVMDIPNSQELLAGGKKGLVATKLSIDLLYYEPRE